MSWSPPSPARPTVSEVVTRAIWRSSLVSLGCPTCVREWTHPRPSVFLLLFCLLRQGDSTKNSEGQWENRLSSLQGRVLKRDPRTLGWMRP